MLHVRLSSVLGAFALAGLPAVAAAGPITPAGVFVHATPVVQAVILGLLAAILAALAVTAAKLSAGPKLSGGSAFLSGLRLGGPLAGLTAAAWSALSMAIGLANVRPTPPAAAFAPGFAEGAMVIALGMFAGLVAAVCHAAVEAKIDRAVLKA
jgi:hypothetical protein